MEKFVYVGSLLCSGTLSDGNPWQGYRIAVGRYDSSGHVRGIIILKAPATDFILDMLDAVSPSDDVRITFDSFGRVVDIRPI